MARAEHDREDLLREATALVERAELQVAGLDASPTRKRATALTRDSGLHACASGYQVVVGFRRDGSFSVFLGSDPVYQFNTAGQLRRAFVDGLLYKAQRGHLVGLRRQRTASETALLRQELGSEEEKAFLLHAREQLQSLVSALQQQQFTLTGQVPPEADVVGRVRQWLAALPEELDVAEKPHSG